MSYEWDNKKPTAQMLGRWQPFHDGHFAFSNGTNSEAKVVFPEPGKPIISIFFINLYVVANLGKGFSSIGKCTNVSKNESAIDKYQA